MTSQVRVGGGRGPQCVEVGINDDQTTEDVEDFQLQLYLNDNTLEAERFVLSPERVTIFIFDNDSKEVVLIMN